MSATELRDWVDAALPVAWLVVAVGVMLLVFWSGLVPTLVRRLKRFSGFGLDLEFSEAAAASNRAIINEGLAELRTALVREIDHKARVKRVFPLLKQLIEQSKNGCELLDKQVFEFRATIHIADPLFENTLYQLVPYYPSGKGSGRSFSTRAGVIGRAWRAEESQPLETTAPITEAELVNRWGMTEHEAHESNARGKHLTSAVILCSRHVPIAVVYFDWDRRKTGPELDTAGWEALAQAHPTFVQDIVAQATALNLVEVLEDLVTDVEANSPRVDLHSI